MLLGLEFLKAQRLALFERRKRRTVDLDQRAAQCLGG